MQKSITRYRNPLLRFFIFISNKRVIIETISSLLIILFVYTGLNKLMDYNTFKFQLGRSPFLDNMDGFIAVTLPVGELLIALTLVIKRFRIIGLYASFFLMALFTGYIYAMLHYSYYLPCSCGGILAALSWQDHLKFNIVFTILPVVGIILTTLEKVQTSRMHA